MPRKRDDVKVWELEGEAVVYDARVGMGHVLNPTALQIWALCDGRNTGDDIARTLATQHPDAKIPIHRDVEAALRQLTQIGLVEAV